MAFNPLSPPVQQPKPIKHSTVKRKRKVRKTANIKSVREQVFDRDEICRLVKLLVLFGFAPELLPSYGVWVELAHQDARGLGGNPDLSRDTTANTFLLSQFLHTGPRSHHSKHLKVRALTDRGMDGPVCFELYEKLPTELS